jgi:hypothetical protein
MQKVSAAARLLAVILAIASAFIANPMIAPALLALGGLAAVGNTPERNAKNYLITLVLLTGADAMRDIPYAGAYLATIFAALGIAFVGASIVAITITLEYRLMRDWVK